MAEIKGGWKRQGFIPASRSTTENASPEPLYAALVKAWRRKGRTVPGRPDPEWEAIVSRDFWPR